MRRLIDTNILIYAFGEGWKAEVAQATLAARPVVSVQALTEFVGNARRKLAMSWTAALAARDMILEAADLVVPISLDVHREGTRLTERYQLNIFDGMMVAAALTSACDVFWSEDLRNGMMIDGRLQVVNPFLALN